MSINQKRQPKGTRDGGKFAPDVNQESTVDLGDVERDKMRVTNSSGDEFEVRIIRKGERYGLNDCLVNDESDRFFRPSDPILVEFWDAGQDPKRFQGGCQFVNRYGLGTLLSGGTDVGLNLYGGEPRWSIDADAMKSVYEWLEPITTEAKDAS